MSLRKKESNEYELPRFAPGRLARVEGPNPNFTPKAISDQLDQLSCGARFTYYALVNHGQNPHGAVFASRETLSAKRVELGATLRGSSSSSISRHLRDLEDAGLIVRLHSRTEGSTGGYRWLPLVLLLGVSHELRKFVGLSGAVTLRLAWGPQGIRQAVSEGIIQTAPYIYGPLLDPSNPRQGRRRIYLDQCLPPRRSGERNGVRYDGAPRLSALHGALRENCLELLERYIQVYRSSGNLRDRSSKHSLSRRSKDPSRLSEADCPREESMKGKRPPLSEGAAPRATVIANSSGSRLGSERQSARQRGTSRALARKSPSSNREDAA